MRITVILITALLHYGESQICLSGLSGWKGSLYYPQMKGTQSNRPFFTKGETMRNNCVFYLNAVWAKEIQLTVGMIRVGAANVLIKIFTRSTKNWQDFHSLTGNIPMWIDLTARNATYLKIVVPKTAGSFFIDYKLNSCPPLPTSMKILACTKDRYFGSQCVMECADEYYSRKINENKFHARCGRKPVNGKLKYVWIYTQPASKKICVSKTTVEEYCFNEISNPKCPFKFNDLLLLMGERYEIPKREERPRMAFDASSRSLGSPLLPPAVARYASKLLIKTCKKNFCGFNLDKKDYVPVCDTMKRKGPKRVCMMCRHSRTKPCEAPTPVLS